MGFFSFNLAYYRDEIRALEAGAATETAVCHAKRLMKILDDLADEGYTELGTALETEFQGVSRLRAWLRNANAAPFSVRGLADGERDAVWSDQTWELEQALAEDEREADISPGRNEPFLQELTRFCQWLGREEDTAYVFLLRDTLLPWAYCRAAGRGHLYPWLLGRRALELRLGKPGVDDELRASIYEALERTGAENFERFCDAALPGMRRTLERYPALLDALTALLGTVRERRVLVVESGCAGTFPLLLRCLDERVEMRMYTTYPYLLKVYGQRVYTERYEQARRFETLAAQGSYLQLAAWRGERFYVRRNTLAEVRARALGEIKVMRTEGRTS